MSRNKAKTNIIIFIIVGLFFGGGYLYTIYVETAEIKKDFSHTTGKIYEFAETGERNMRMYTRYKYTVNGKEYERGSYTMDPCEGMENFRNEIMNFTYPIVYHNEDPEKSRILISPKQFEEYGLAYPEDLREFYEKYWGCK